MAKDSSLVKKLVWVALGIVTASIGGWWLARLLREEEEAEEAVWMPPQRPQEVSIPLMPPPAEDDVSGPVDFTRIDGIGLKYAEGLVDSGITSFQQLSEQDPEHLAEALRTCGLRVSGDRIVQDDWIGQARRLIAEGLDG